MNYRNRNNTVHDWECSRNNRGFIIRKWGKMSINEQIYYINFWNIQTKYLSWLKLYTVILNKCFWILKIFIYSDLKRGQLPDCYFCDTFWRFLGVGRVPIYLQSGRVQTSMAGIRTGDADSSLPNSVYVFQIFNVNFIIKHNNNNNKNVTKQDWQFKLILLNLRFDN